MMLFLSIICAFLATSQCTDEFSSPQVVNSGQQQYELLHERAKLPMFGECWINAIKSLHSGCNNLNDDIQSRLALQFANCFLTNSGLTTYPCEDDTPIATCIKNIDSNAFVSYANFFTHTHNMCHFLKAQSWNEQTQSNIQRLSQSSASVAESLEKHQVSLESSRNNLKHMLREFRDSTSEQKMMILQIFDRVSQLRSLVVSEMSWLYAAIFYFCSVVFVHLVTSTRRTSDARLILYSCIVLTLCVERCYVSLHLISTENSSSGGDSHVFESGSFFLKPYLPESWNDVLSSWWSPSIGKWSSSQRKDQSDESIMMDDMAYNNESLYRQVWFVRKMSLLFCLAVIVYKTYMFVDYNKVINSRLEEIFKQNMEIKSCMQEQSVFNRDQSRSSGHLTTRSPDVTEHAAVIKLDEFSSDSSYDESSDDETDTDIDSNLSFMTTRSDKTYTPDLFNVKRDKESSAKLLENERDEREYRLSLLDQKSEVSDRPIDKMKGVGITRSSPLALRRISQKSWAGGDVLSLDQQLVNQSPTVMTRRRLSQKSSELSSNGDDSSSMISTSYNLRPIQRNILNESRDVPDADSINESPEQFGELVRKLSNISRRNSSKLTMSQRNRRIQSSDEDDENTDSRSVSQVSRKRFSRKTTSQQKLEALPE